MGNMGLVRAGGVCAILAVVSVIAGIMVRGLAGLPGLRDLTLGAEQWFLDVGDNRTAFLIHWGLLFLGAVLAIPAVLGFYQALRQAGSLLWIAVAAWFTSFFLRIVGAMTIFGIGYELVPAYAEASETTKPALAAIASTLVATTYVPGSFPFESIALALFALAILRTSVMPRWLGWLGLAAALLQRWPQQLRDVSEVFTAIGFLGLLLMLVWIVIMGVFLLRLRQPVAGTGET